MNKKLIKIVCLVICMCNVLALMILPVGANSAQTEWRGADSAGTVVRGGECPIVVTKETLTFDIDEFPEYHYYSNRDNYSYSPTVKAEYTFYNPSDLTVTAKLDFPFGAVPGYYIGNDTNSYNITVDGEPVERKIRYTLNSGDAFELDVDLSKLSDEYMTDGFYTPDMTVTKYTYRGNSTPSNYKETYKARTGFDWDYDNSKSRVYFPGITGYHDLENGGVRISTTSAGFNKHSTVYVIGEPLSDPLEWKSYKDYKVADEDEISCNIKLDKTETMTFKDFVLEYRENDDISEVDWYNAVVCGLNSGKCFDEGLLSATYGRDLNSDKYRGYLMRWYEYEITVAPGQSIVNTVTAPIYPSVDADYSPTAFTYTYLLSPAKTWKSFGELEIIVNTPYYIIDNSIDGFTKTDTGYTVTLEGLPDEELEFVLCKSDDPELYGAKLSHRKRVSSVLKSPITYIVAAGLFIVFIVIRKKKRG